MARSIWNGAISFGMVSIPVRLSPATQDRDVSFHLLHEPQAAEILGIPYDEVMQVGLIPVAYTRGTDFRPAPRRPLETMVHWDRW